MRWAETRADPQHSLKEAMRLQEDAAHVGFDWPSLEPLWAKLSEEIAELKDAVAGGNPDEIQDELGDMFFMLVNFARFLKVPPESALHSTNLKFIHRLQHIESSLAQRGQNWQDASLDELEMYWQQAKDFKQP